VTTPQSYRSVLSLVWDLVHLVDQGAQAEIETVTSRVDDGTVLAWLRTEYGVPASTSDEAHLLEAFQSLRNAVDAERKFGVTRNGLALLLAWCIELYQQGLIS